MMQWKKDLESLVEQTRAMVKHASQRGIGAAARSEVPPAPEPIQSSSAPKPAPPPKPSPQKTAQPQKTASPQSWSTPQLTFDAPAREEILQRVAGFRAHQEKMRREREDYYLEMTEKMRAILRNDIQSKH